MLHKLTEQALLIGNDIIDITAPENLTKFANKRLVRRVLSVNEQKQLSKSQHPELVFLSIWAAKESAYKLLKKCDPDLLFAHAKFEVSGADDFIARSTNAGIVVDGDLKTARVNYSLNAHEESAAVDAVDINRVTIEAVAIKIEWQLSDSWLHCVARNTDSPTPYTQCIEHISSDLIKGDFSEQEQNSIYSDQSKAVRNLAKRLLRKHNINNARIIRHKEQRRYSPPLIYVNNKRIKNFDLSLSHDGKFMAAVLASESEGQ